MEGESPTLSFASVKQGASSKSNAIWSLTTWRRNWLSYLYHDALQCITLEWIKKINMTTAKHFFQLILIWVWNIEETYIFILKFKVSWSLLPDSVVNFFTHLYQFFAKIIINVPWQDLSNFLSVVLGKLPVNV